MGDILNTFGINWALLVAQIINFLIVFYVLKRFFYRKILDALHERKKTIQEGLKQAEEAKALLQKTEEREKEVLRKAQEESRKLLDETRKQRDEIMTEAEAHTKIQAQKILNDARKQIENETREAQKALSLQISGIAIEMLEKSVGEMFSKEDQEKIVKHAIQKIKKRVD